MFTRIRKLVIQRGTVAALLVTLSVLSACGGSSASDPPVTPAAGSGSQPAPKPASGWTAVGPAPPAIQAPLAVDPVSHRTYVGSFGGGIYVTDPASNVVTATNNGLKSLAVNALAMAPTDSATLYAAVFSGGIYKTTDGGRNWSITGETGNIMLYLAVDPYNASTVYAAYNGAVYSIRKSTDGGQTWSTASAGIPTGTAVFALTIDPKNPDVLYASTTGNGAFRSTNGGATWSAMSIEPVVWAITIDPVDSRLLYAATNGSGVYRSANSGQSWTRMGAPSLGVVHALIKVGDRLIAGTASEGIFVSDDEGATWQRSDYAINLHGSNSSPPYIHSLAMVLSLSADAAGRIYAGSSQQGVWISTDRGRTWDTHVVNNELFKCTCQNGYSVAVGPAARHYVYFGTNDGGLFVSDFQYIGTWYSATPTMTARAPRSLAFNPVKPSSMYLGSFVGSGFFKTDDGGETWQRKLFGPSTLHVTTIAVTPDGGTIYLTTLGGAGLWKSTDGGDTFQRIDVATPGGPFLNLAGRGIAVDPTGGPNVYLAGPGGVWRSRDRGATWARVSTVSSLTVNVHPVDPTIVLVGTQASGVLKSSDSGATFVASNTGLTDLRTGRAGGVLVHRLKPDTYYVNTEGSGIFKSRDAGVTWTAVNKDLGDLTVFGMAIDPSDPDTVFAATQKSVYMTRSGGE